MNMPQRQIVQPGACDLRLGDIIVRALVVHGVAVQHHQLRQPVPLCREARQQVSCLRPGERRAVDPAAKLREFERGDRALRENMYVLRPFSRPVGGACGRVVMVSRRNDDLRAAGRKRPRKRLDRLRIDVIAVKEVARQQHQSAVIRVGQLRQLHGNGALLLPALRRALRAQAGKRRVEMQIRRM